MVLSFRTERTGQTVQTQIRLYLEEQSDQDLHCLLFHLHLLEELLHGRTSHGLSTVKFLNVQTTENFPVIYLKFKQRPSLMLFHQKVANGVANSEDPDQTAHWGAVWSGSSLFAQTNLSENLGSLRYKRIYSSYWLSIYLPNEMLFHKSSNV